MDHLKQQLQERREKSKQGKVFSNLITYRETRKPRFKCERMEGEFFTEIQGHLFYSF